MIKVKRVIDVLMLVCMLLLMTYALLSEVAHEYIGIAIFILFIIHNILNFNWWTKIFSGKYNARRVLMVLINVSLLILMVLQGISGFVVSKYIFVNYNTFFDSSIFREIHMVCGYFMLIIISLHLGLNATALFNKIKIIVPIVAIYGMYAIYKTKIFSMITLRTGFAYLDYDAGLIINIIWFFAITMFFAYIGFYINRILYFKDKGEM